MRGEAHGFCLLPGCRNQVGNSDLKAQTWTSLSHLVPWGGGLEMWHDLPSALFAKWFHCRDSLSAAACKSSCQLPAQQRSSNSKQDTVLIQPPETLGTSPDWADSLFDLTPVGAIKWHMYLRYLPESSFAYPTFGGCITPGANIRHPAASPVLGQKIQRGRGHLCHVSRHTNLCNALWITPLFPSAPVKSFHSKTPPYSLCWGIEFPLSSTGLRYLRISAALRASVWAPGAST